MTRKTLIGVTGMLLGLTLSTFAAAGGLGSADRIEATQRRVIGIITAADDASVTITPVRGRAATVTGRIDASRTKILVDGRAAKPGELRVTQSARGELGLDEVWMSIAVDSGR